MKVKTSLKKGDMVQVIAGKDKGKQGKILNFVKSKSGLDKVLVEGVNIIKKHMKPSQANENGGIVEVEGAIAISNVMFLDKKEKKPTRLGSTVDKNSNKKRISKKSKEIID